MGILASLDPVALDKACIDMIKKYIDAGTDERLYQLKNLSGKIYFMLQRDMKLEPNNMI